MFCDSRGDEFVTLRKIFQIMSGGRRIQNLRSRPVDFATINEKPVDDVSISLFYEPRTLTLLCLGISALIYVAFNR